MGIACATWVAISRGSTLRDIFNAMGDPHSLAVYRANKAVSRHAGSCLSDSDVLFSNNQ